MTKIAVIGESWCTSGCSSVEHLDDLSDELRGSATRLAIAVTLFAHDILA